MSIQTTCPNCDAPFTLNDAMAGKKIRCGKCQEVFTAKAAPARRRAVEDDGDDESDKTRVRERPATAPAKTGTTKSSPNRRAILSKDDDFEEDDRPSRREPVKKEKNNVPWIVGGAVLCVAMLVGGGITIAMMMNKSPDAGPVSTPKIATQPDTTAKAPEPKTTPIAKGGGGLPDLTPDKLPPSDTPSTTPATGGTTTAKAEDKPKPPDRDPTRRGEPSRDVIEAVKRATVYIRVTMPDNSMASGTGFFGAPDAGNIVLTNAHVVGMLSPLSKRPKKIEIILNSGEEGKEKNVSALVLGVDRASDLAVLDVGTTLDMPKPLTVKSADELRELDKVYVFGFPLGERLGKEITVRPSSVSSLRKSTGILDRIQVAGGMDEGNSGGPVVDEFGHVVGVAVAGIPGRMINFAIPGERVYTALNGRLAELGLGQSFKTGEKTGVPVTMGMIDPRGRIKEVGVEVWVGNRPASSSPTRPPSNTAPPMLAGDLGREFHKLSYVGGLGKGDVPLPQLPAGRAWWVQPRWKLANGNTHWGVAQQYAPKDQPLDRKAVSLFGRYAGLGSRKVDISVVNKLRVGIDVETEVATYTSKASLTETGTSVGGGVRLLLAYQSADHTRVINNKKETHPHLNELRGQLKRVVALVEMDAAGNIVANGVRDDGSLAASESGKHLVGMHHPIQFALNSLLVTMPNREVKPLEPWKLQRRIGINALGLEIQADLDLTYTYLGVRNVAGRDEAVVTIDGLIKDDKIAGRARGLASVDMGTGVIRKVEYDLDIELPTLEVELEGGKKEKLRLLTLQQLRLDRSL